jgi:hypothetical protein
MMNENYKPMPARESGSQSLKWRAKETVIDENQLQRNRMLKYTPRTTPIYPYEIVK